MEIKIVERDPKKLKFDPNQPRKKFDAEVIENIAKTYETQEIINEPEIDGNDMIITGELRVRGAIKKGLSKIKCKVLVGLSKEDRFERQVIENLHHSLLADEDKENAIRKLWDSGKYTSEAELASRIGMSKLQVKHILNLKEIRKRLGINMSTSPISSATLYHIQRLSIEDQKKVIQKIKVKQLKQGSDLRELVLEIKKLPNDLKDAVLNIESPIDLETAKTISIVIDQEQRKELINEIKLTTKMLEDNIQYRIKIAKGEIPPEPIILVNNLEKILRAMIRFRINTRRVFRMEDIRSIESMEIRMKIREIIEDTIGYLENQLKGFESPQKILEIKGV